MKKKFLSLALSGLLACSAAFGLAACKPQEGTGGGTLDNNGGGTIEPGTVITEGPVKNAILSALAEAEPQGFVFSGGALLSFAQGEGGMEQKISAEGAFLAGEDAAGDVYLTLESEYGKQYFLGFLRGNDVYATGFDDGSGKTDLNQIKEQLKATEDPLLLDKSEAGPIGGILKAPAVWKLCKNVLSLTDGVVTKTEGGFDLTFAAAEGAANLLDGAEAVADAIDKNAAMTLSGLFSQEFVDDTLTALLRGISAKELAALFPLLPAEIGEILPKPASGTAKDYLLGLLRSGEFYTALTGESEPWTNYRTFGEVPLSELVSALTGGETEIGSLKLKEMLSALRSGAEDKLVSLLLDPLGIDGSLSGGKAELSATFSFDGDKKLLGFSLEALAAGNVTESELQADGGSAPEDGNGDGMTTPTAAKLQVSLKLGATCVQSPALFSLKGCQYSGENGAVPIE